MTTGDYQYVYHKFVYYKLLFHSVKKESYFISTTVYNNSYL